MRRCACSLLLTGMLAGCQQASSRGVQAAAAYPAALHTTDIVAIQVFRSASDIELVNATAVDYQDATLWINQQFTHPLPSLPAGSAVSLNLWSFHDRFGEPFNAGGLWRTDEPDSLVMIEIQRGEAPMVGLLVVGSP